MLEVGYTGRFPVRELSTDINMIKERG